MALPSDIKIEKILNELSESGKPVEKSSFPSDIKPMLATLATSPPEGEKWIFEIKWDGFRAMAYLTDGSTELRSRNNKNFNDKFYPLWKALQALKVNAVLDGEIIAVTDNGIADFSALQNWRSEADGQLIYYVFDLLWINGFNLMNIPLSGRKKILQEILSDKGIVRISESFQATGKELFEVTAKMNLEGIIAKNAESRYLPALRSKEWLKIKTQHSQEVVIAGYTKNSNSGRPFSALLTGVYENGQLIFTTPVGTGFTAKIQKELIEKFHTIETTKCPFNETPEFNKPSRFRPAPEPATVTWLKPELVAEISFKTVSPDGTMRHPSFKGLREDKNAKEVIAESEQLILPVTENEKVFLISTEKHERKTLLNPSEETQVRKIDGHDLKFPNLSKIYWPEERITKRDLLNYYYRIAPFILPHITNRPLTLNRFPNGIYHQSFYQKDVTSKVPAWIKTYPYYSETDQKQKNFMVCNDEASLLYIASLGCIEINPWSSRTESPDNPDWCIIDLDPDQNTFDQVVEAALVTKALLDSLHIPSFCKTSGSSGLHIYIPLGAKYTYEDSKEFARVIARTVQQQIPSYTTIERYTSKRNGKMYIDFLQNRPQATVASVYSVRPRAGATVSMPLHWDEVKIGLHPSHFTLMNASERLKDTGDLFEGVLGSGIDIGKIKKQLL